MLSSESRHEMDASDNCTRMVATPIGMSSHVMNRRILLMPLCSSEWTSENLDAWAVNWAA